MESKDKNTSPKDACRRIARECSAVRLRLISRVITAIYDNALRTFGVTINQLNLLVAISRTGGSTNAKHLGQVFRMESSTLSRNLERMCKEGWLQVTSGMDARTRRWKLTRKGDRLIGKVFPAWEEAQKQSRKLLGDSYLHAIAEMGSRIWSASSIL
jgi:DNA-binding MarR family transcriptional regulator